MKKAVAVIFCILCLFVSVTAFGEENAGKCGDKLTWHLDENGTFTVSGTGEMYGYEHHNYADWHSIRESIRKVKIESGVTSVGFLAFYQCENITEVILPDGLIYIDARAFSECRKLKEIIIPEGVVYIGDGAFDNCRELEYAAVPESVVYLGEAAFRFCEKLKPFKLPENLYHVGYMPFYDVPSMENIEIPGHLEAEGGKCGENLTWSINHDKTLTISGTGEMTETPWRQRMEWVETLIIEPGVTSVREHAFSGYIHLESVILPDTLVSIGDDAFCECILLKNITIPESVTSIGTHAFFGCKNIVKTENGENFILYEGTGRDNFNWKINCYGTLTVSGTGEMTDTPWKEYSKHITEIVLEEGITSVVQEAFINCKNLTLVKLPESMVSINDRAFKSCRSLTDIVIPSGVKNLSKTAFESCDSLKNLKINMDAVPVSGSCGENLTWEFDGQGTLTVSGTGNMGYYSEYPWIYVKNAINKIVIEEGVTSVELEAFQNCISLKEITLPDSIALIGEGAFKHCIKLESITIPKGVTMIQGSTFYNCDALKNVLLPDGIDFIGYNAFDGCRSLEEIDIPDSVREIKSKAFFRCRSLKKAVIPEGVKAVESAVFGECMDLKEVILPDSVEEIGAGAFYQCSNLKNIDLGEGVKSIGVSAFYNCSDLESIYFPDGVSILPQLTFEGCKSLKTVYASKEIEFTEENMGSCLGNVKVITRDVAGIIEVYCNGDKVYFDQPPIMKNSRVLVPVRKICEKMGMNVSWDKKSNTATISNENTLFEITLNNRYINVDDSKIHIDVPAEAINGRILIPIRAFAEAFGCRVEWDEDAEMVIVSR